MNKSIFLLLLFFFTATILYILPVHLIMTLAMIVRTADDGKKKLNHENYKSNKSGQIDSIPVSNVERIFH